MHGKMTMYIDQYGNRFHARTLHELREKVGGGKISKMYVDGKDGKTYHVGYVVGKHWLNAFIPLRKAVS